MAQIRERRIKQRIYRGREQRGLGRWWWLWRELLAPPPDAVTRELSHVVTALADCCSSTFPPTRIGGDGEATLDARKISASAPAWASAHELEKILSIFQHFPRPQSSEITASVGHMSTGLRPNLVIALPAAVRGQMSVSCSESHSDKVNYSHARPGLGTSAQETLAQALAVQGSNSTSHS